ncbi:MAG: pyrroloquinoline quinone biosynthesis peptide chaperone PqqD [Gammaproteobacteria bacterium]|jgi:pyrroloquinoline quinone biosynthesis protein D|nr:pyrroloquinoline quinone biosynthesis peptide chaperone PqqD [Gammaproteobacteria bacterium]|tara:strand:+ start:64 stop:345 length:282 start_codon:yes stop_codon:yes gene_type:complete
MIDFDTKKFHINPNYRLQFEEAQKCHVLLYPEGLVKLSDTAVEILSRCKQAVHKKTLIEDLQKDYPEAETLAADVSDFLEHAASESWLVVVED